MCVCVIRCWPSGAWWSWGSGLWRCGGWWPGTSPLGSWRSPPVAPAEGPDCGSARHHSTPRSPPETTQLLANYTQPPPAVTHWSLTAHITSTSTWRDISTINYTHKLQLQQHSCRLTTSTHQTQTCTEPVTTTVTPEEETERLTFSLSCRARNKGKTL